MDALEVLRQEANLRDDDHATAHVGFLRLPSNEKIGLLSIRHSDTTQRVNCVSLPAATHFTAIPDNLPVRRRFNIALLDQARIEANGRVRLLDGAQLRALEVEPAILPRHPTELDWRVVHLALELIEAKDCYSSLRKDVRSDERKLVPDIYFLDLDMIRQTVLPLPPLRDIVSFIASRYRRVSAQQVANALRKFGIRLAASTYKGSSSSP